LHRGLKGGHIDYIFLRAVSFLSSIFRDHLSVILR
jgi:hypothetical protein